MKNNRRFCKKFAGDVAAAGAASIMAKMAEDDFQYLDTKEMHEEISFIVYATIKAYFDIPWGGDWPLQSFEPSMN